MNPGDVKPPRNAPRRKAGFAEDFRRFFLRGLAALLPTLITLWLLVWVWNFLWESLGRHLIDSIVWIWNSLIAQGRVPFKTPVEVRYYWNLGLPEWQRQAIGVGLAVLLVYVVGLFVGNLIGRTIWRLAEVAVMRIPLIRAIYPAVKQVTDFVLAERKQQFQSTSVVAVQPHAMGIWSIGLVTGSGLQTLSDKLGEEMVTVFIPSSPTAFSGYVVVVPRESVVELPLKVEEAMRLLVSGGVITPPAASMLSSGVSVPAVAPAPLGALPSTLNPTPASQAQ